MFDIIDIYTNMVTCALFPDAYESLKESTSQKLGEWCAFDDDTLELSGVWLPQTVRRIRCVASSTLHCITLCYTALHSRECVKSLEGLGLPEKGMTVLHNLATNVRSLCMDTLFQRASKGNYELII